MHLVYRGNTVGTQGQSLVLAIRVSQVIDLVPEVREARIDDEVVARLALWLAEVSAEAALAARNGDGPPSEQPEPE
jgi:hypothetical protein